MSEYVINTSPLYITTVPNCYATAYDGPECENCPIRDNCGDDYTFAHERLEEYRCDDFEPDCADCHTSPDCGSCPR